MGCDSIPEHLMDSTEYLEVTTHVGCSVNCKKYCPQEVLVKRYGNNPRNLSLDSFKKMISTVPTEVILVFSGFCEPFLNPECVDLMEYAHQKGHRLILNTTLVGLKLSDLDRLSNLNIIKGILHLPDYYDNAHIPITDEYKSLLVRFLKLFPNMQYISMNDQFPTNNHENVTRGILPKRKWYPISCAKLHTPQYILFPNADVYMCCMDFGLDLKIGNLLTDTYSQIRESEHLKRIKHDNIIGRDTLCRYCSFSLPIPVYYTYMTLKNWYYARKTRQQIQYKK
jgi:radical SAM protein with 4Fe4S-binding SPASM domain